MCGLRTCVASTHACKPSASEPKVKQQEACRLQGRGKIELEKRPAQGVQAPPFQGCASKLMSSISRGNSGQGPRSDESGEMTALAGGVPQREAQPLRRPPTLENDAG